jgi:hypothetical protein
MVTHQVVLQKRGRRLAADNAGCTATQEDQQMRQHGMAWRAVGCETLFAVVGYWCVCLLAIGVECGWSGVYEGSNEGSVECVDV